MEEARGWSLIELRSTVRGTVVQQTGNVSLTHDSTSDVLLLHNRITGTISLTLSLCTVGQNVDFQDEITYTSHARLPLFHFLKSRILEVTLPISCALGYNS